ncbi:MAG: hypothetical protein JJE13_07660 [Thermoleophilia bacterium]|nr:hypothetical protein [Thermoleophilia bacterium]
MAEIDPEKGRQIPISWVGVEELPLQFANQFIATVDGQTAFVAIGSLQPPPIIGETIEEIKAQAEAIAFIPVKPIARVALSVDSLNEFARILKETASNMEKVQREKGQG